MAAIELLYLQSQEAWVELLGSLTGVTQAQAWGVLPDVGADYLHTDGSIQGVALHVATSKRMYGSIAFRNGELRWRECAEHLDAFEPNWEKAHAYLVDSHEYWLSTWAKLADDDLMRKVPHFSGTVWPVWRILQTVIHHDAYHAGQIAMLRYAVAATDKPPPSSAEDIRTHCRNLPNW